MVIAKLPWSTSRPSAAEDAVGGAVRYDIGGEIWRRRRRVQGEAIRAAMVEQQEGADAKHRARARVTRMDGARPASAYRPGARGALTCARRVAEEDAEVVAEILAEDLRGGTRHPSPSTRKTIAAGGPPVRGDARAIRTLTAGLTTATDEVVDSFFTAVPGTLHR